jgi:hypothetical protein
MKLAREPSSQRQARTPGAPCPVSVVRHGLLFWERQYTWANDKEGIDVGISNEPVEVGIDENEAGACTPMAEQPGLDIGVNQGTFEQDIGAQEDHGYSVSEGRRAGR